MLWDLSYIKKFDTSLSLSLLELLTTARMPESMLLVIILLLHLHASAVKATTIIDWVLDTGLPVNRPAGRLGSAMWTIANQTASDDIFLYGGVMQGVNNISQEVWHYSISSQIWTLARAAGGAGNADRAFAQVQWTPIGLVVEGGLTYDTGTNKYLSNQLDVFAWNPVLFGYVAGGANFVPVVQPPRLLGQTMSYVNGALYLIGGFVQSSGQYEDRLTLTSTLPVAVNVSLDPAYGLSFNSLRTSPHWGTYLLQNYAFHTATVIDTHIWVLGGRTLDSFDNPQIADYDYGAYAADPNTGGASVQSYDAVNDIWTDHAPAQHFARWGHTAELNGGLIYVFGGRDGHDNNVNELRSLDPVAMSWTIYSVTHLPLARTFHSMVVAQFQQGCRALFVHGGTTADKSTFALASSLPLAQILMGDTSPSITPAQFLGDLDMIILPPTITSFAGCTPVYPNVTNCLPGGNNPLTINGANLGGTGATISIGGVNCPITSQTNAQIVCMLPPAPSKIPNVTISMCTTIVNLTGVLTYADECSTEVAPSARFGTVMWSAPNTTIVSDTLFVYGGMTPFGTTPNPISQEVWRYNISGSCWSQVRSNYVNVSGGGWPARAFAKGAHTPDGFVIVGGHPTDPNNVVVDQIDVVAWQPLLFDMSRTNVPIAVNPPPPLYAHTVNYVNGTFFIIGGWTCASPSPAVCSSPAEFPEGDIKATTDFVDFDFGVTDVAALAGQQRVGFHTSTLLNGLIYIYGGCSASTVNAVSQAFLTFNPVTYALTTVTPVGAPQRWGHSTVAFNGLLYVYGGRERPSPQAYHNTLYSVDAGVTNTFTLLSEPTVPSARGYHSMLVTQFQPSCYALAIYGGTTDTSFITNNLVTFTLLSNIDTLVRSALPDMNIVVLQQPTVTYFDGCTPDYPNVIYCNVSGGQSLTIIGTNLNAPSAYVYVDGLPCPITSNNGTAIVCTLPAVDGPKETEVLLTVCDTWLNFTDGVGYGLAPDIVSTASSSSSTGGSNNSSSSTAAGGSTSNSSSTASATASSSGKSSSTGGSSTVQRSNTTNSSTGSRSSTGVSVNVSSSSSSSAVTVVAPAARIGLTDAQLYAAIFGTVGGVLFITGSLVALAWVMGWGAFAPTATAVSVVASGTNAVATPGSAAEASAHIGGRARIDEERFPLVGARPPSTKQY